jgi:hypothetical protein
VAERALTTSCKEPLHTAAIVLPPPNTVTRNILELDLKLPVGIVFQSEVSFPGSTLHSLISQLKTSLKEL